MAQGPLVRYFGAPSYNFSTLDVSAGRGALHVASLQIAWSEGKKKGDRGDFQVTWEGTWSLGPCTAPGVVLFSEDLPNEILSTMDCQQTMRLGPFPSHSCFRIFRRKRTDIVQVLLTLMVFPAVAGHYCTAFV
jgi:hypothetical protein